MQRNKGRGKILKERKQNEVLGEQKIRSITKRKKKKQQMLRKAKVKLMLIVC